MPVVVSAGNWYHSDEVESMSAWAEAPWTISVGATDSPTGGEILPMSSGGEDAVPGSGPDVVAYGASALDPNRLGTSYSAPEVTRALVLLGCFMATVRYCYQRARGKCAEGIPVGGLGNVDKEIDPRFAARSLELSALPAFSVRADALEQLVAIMRNNDIDDIQTWPSPSILRRMLFRAARRLPDVPIRLQGHGFINDDVIGDYLAAFDGEELLKLGLAKDPRVDDLATLVRGINLSDASSTSDRTDLWIRSARRWLVDIAV
jgi:hypothetical protein